MTQDWEIIIPKENTNLVLNPSMEKDSTGYTADSATITRSDEQAYWGAYGIKVEPNGDQEGLFYTHSSLVLASGTTYTASFYMSASAGLNYQLGITTVGGVPLHNEVFVSSEGWNRYSFQYTEQTGTAQRRIYILTEDNLGDTSTFYIDGLNVVVTTDDETYIDGDQEGCYWNGAEHGSTSVRDGQYRNGGKIINFGDYDVEVKQMQGIGMAPVQHYSQEYGLLDGALYQGSKIRPRVFQLTSQIVASGIQNLHVKREQFIDAIKLNLVGKQQPLTLRYNGSGEIRQIKALYEDGMAFDTATPFMEVLPLRFVSYDPFWYEEGNQAGSIPPVVLASGIITQRNKYGEWDNLDATYNGAVKAIDYDKLRGYYVFGGAFTLPQAGVSKYDPIDGTYSLLGGFGVSGGGVNAVAIDQITGDVYIGGDFTTVVGVPNTRGLAKWDRVTDTWETVGNGLLNGAVNTLAFGHNRVLYFGGTFTLASGVANTVRVGMYDIASDSIFALGTGMNNTVNDIALSPNGTPYFTGAFTASNGVTTRGLAYWNGSTFVAAGGLTGNITGMALAFGKDGAMYLGFDGTTINGSTYNYIAKYTGSQWLALGEGFNDNPVAIEVDNDGNVIVVGDFFEAGDLTLPSDVALWNGSQWYPFGLRAGNASSLYINRGNNDITIGWSSASVTIKQGTTTITNRGSADAYPVIYIDGPTSGTAGATAFFMTNHTTGDTIYFNTDLALSPGERFTLDLTPGNKSFTSNFQGNIMGKIIPGSNVGTMRLIPGINHMSFFVGLQSVGISVRLVWTPKYLSSD